MNREEWLLARRKGIGGSDAAAAVGMSRWRTPLELFLDKRGELTNNEETAPMRWGNLLEPVVRQEIATQTGRTIITPEHTLIWHKSLPFAFATVDGIADGTRLVECKTSRSGDGWGEPGSDQIPEEYQLQVQHCLAVTGLVVADVGVLIGGSDFRLYEVPADNDVQAILFDLEAEFWRSVETGEPPEPINRDDVRRRWRKSTDGAIQADDEAIAAINELRSLKEALAAAEDRADELASIIQSKMQAAAELVAGDKKLATWKNVNTSPRFDLESFKAKHEDLWKQFLKPAAIQRRFLLSKGK